MAACWNVTFENLGLLFFNVKVIRWKANSEGFTVSIVVKIQETSRKFLAATVKGEKQTWQMHKTRQPTEKPSKHNAVMTKPIPTSLMFYNVSHTLLYLLSFVAPRPDSKENWSCGNCNFQVRICTSGHEDYCEHETNRTLLNALEQQLFGVRCAPE